MTSLRHRLDKQYAAVVAAEYMIVVELQITVEQSCTEFESGSAGPWPETYAQQLACAYFPARAEAAVAVHRHYGAGKYISTQYRVEHAVPRLLHGIYKGQVEIDAVAAYQGLVGPAHLTAVSVCISGNMTRGFYFHTDF